MCPKVCVQVWSHDSDPRKVGFRKGETFKKKNTEKVESYKNK